MTDTERGLKGYLDYMDPGLINKALDFRHKEADEPLCYRLLNQIKNTPSNLGKIVTNKSGYGIPQLSQRIGSSLISTWNI
jgi:hypothetical protein